MQRVTNEHDWSNGCALLMSSFVVSKPPVPEGCSVQTNGAFLCVFRVTAVRSYRMEYGIFLWRVTFGASEKIRQRANHRYVPGSVEEKQSSLGVGGGLCITPLPPSRSWQRWNDKASRVAACGDTTLPQHLALVPTYRQHRMAGLQLALSVGMDDLHWRCHHRFSVKSRQAAHFPSLPRLRGVTSIPTTATESSYMIWAAP